MKYLKRVIMISCLGWLGSVWGSHTPSMEIENLQAERNKILIKMQGLKHKAVHLREAQGLKSIDLLTRNGIAMRDLQSKLDDLEMEIFQRRQD